MCIFPNKLLFVNIVSFIFCYIRNLIVPLIFSLTILTFIWGVIQFVMNGNNEEIKAKGRNFMILGILGLTVMVSIWGIVHVVGDTFGIDTTFIPQLKSR